MVLHGRRRLVAMRDVQSIFRRGDYVQDITRRRDERYSLEYVSSSKGYEQAKSEETDDEELESSHMKRRMIEL